MATLSDILLVGRTTITSVADIFGLTYHLRYIKLFTWHLRNLIAEVPHSLFSSEQGSDRTLHV